MNEIIKLQQKIVPEVIELFTRRYNILRTIFYNEPIGRRILANHLELGERTIRNEVTFLKERNLIEVFNEGMYVTKEGQEIIGNLADILKEFKGLNEIEEKIKNYLNIEKVIIVPGDYENDKTVIHEVGKVTANYVKNILEDKFTIAITGGSTIKEVVNNFPKLNKYKDIVVLPARGGLGRDVETQANTLTAKLAEKIGGSYKLLHVPDSLSEAALEGLMKEKSIEEIVQMMRNSDLLIYGIGRADEMAFRRDLDKDTIERIMSKEAVGEALGNYYNDSGDIVYNNSTVGVRDEDAQKLKKTIAVAAGKNKARAIIGTQINRKNGVLIIDEGASTEILDIIDTK